MERLHFRVGHMDDAERLIRAHHYSRRMAGNVQYVCTWHRDGGLFGDFGEAVAACTFSIPPTRWALPVLELSRLVRVPDGLGNPFLREAGNHGSRLMDTYDPREDGRRGYEVAIDALRSKLESYRCERIGDATLYLGDCREILPLLPKVDAVVTDPPYGIAYSQNINRRSATTGLANNKTPPRLAAGKVIVGDTHRFDPAPFVAFDRAVLWGANHYADALPRNGSWLIWDKRCGVYPELDQADAEIAWCSAGSTVRVFRWLWTGLVRQKVEKAARGENVRRHHPFEKPVELLEWCIERFKDDPHTILDPFMGSGTTGVACIKLGRKFIGIEIDETYFEIACKRIRQAYAQPDMFIEAEKRTAPVQLEMI